MAIKPLNNAELATFCGEMDLLLRAGIAPAEGLSTLAEDTPAGEGRTLLQGLYECMEQGEMFCTALERSGAFPAYMCNLVQLGEQAGKLDDVLQALGTHYEREDALAASIKQAVTWPLIMLGMMLAVMAVLITRVLPVFDQVFRQLGTGLTGFSGSVLRIGEALGRYSAVFLVLAAVLAAVCAWFAFSERGRQQIRAFGRRFFGTRKLAEKIATARFASGMHLALSSGLDLDESLATVARLVEHPAVAAKAEQMRQRMNEGATFAEAGAETGMFTGLYARMLSIGVRTGTTDEVLAGIAARYDDEIAQQTAGAVARLEPALVALLSVVVGMILLSVMLPLMGIMSGIG